MDRLTNPPDYSVLDRREILQFVFFPRRDWTPAPYGARDFFVPVSEGVSISARLYQAAESIATILYFHGNGEVACDYDWLAPEYNRLGVSLFVADYRGYGRSSGRPTINSMIADSLDIFEFFRDVVVQPKNGLFVMGRSLGSMSALTIASQRADQIAGLIVESGFPAVTRILSYLGYFINDSGIPELEAQSLALVASIGLPTLVIHGDGDTLIPYEEGQLLYNTLSSPFKKMLTIDGAGHNDIMIVGRKLYFEAIAEFVGTVRKKFSQ
ncbi:MAG: lysophospholipase [Dehalococcoidia bacterium]|nr:lysophospholipase [Dehalococcoidia bacterium]